MISTSILQISFVQILIEALVWMSIPLRNTTTSVFTGSPSMIRMTSIEGGFHQDAMMRRDDS